MLEANIHTPFEEGIDVLLENQRRVISGRIFVF
jgi:hypothetical protein